jgi:hypothetical protein
MTGGDEEDGADYSYFYVDNGVFQFGAQSETSDFTIELFAYSYSPDATPNPVVTNERAVGSSGSWSLAHRSDWPDDIVLQLRAGSKLIESGNVWPAWPINWVHIALVRMDDRGMVFVNGTKVIDEEDIFEDTTFALGADSKLSFAGWSLGDIYGWAPFMGWWDEIRISRGARYTESFTSPWGPFPRLP